MGETTWPAQHTWGYVTTSATTSGTSINWAGQPVPAARVAEKKPDDMRWLDQRVREMVNKSGIAA